MKGIYRHRKFFSDVMLNILASAAMTAVLQLILYPYYGKLLHPDQYGTLLLLMGIVNIAMLVFGNSLNNARLIVQKKYEELKISGDFNWIFCISCFVNIAFVICFTLIFDLTSSIATVIGVCVISLLGTIRCYYSVEYRIILDFKKILLQSVFYCVGGMLTFLVVRQFGGSWTLPFAGAELGACIYSFFTVSLFKESLKKTILFKESSRTYMFLIITTLIANLIQYIDRLLLHPIMGGEDVAVYTTAAWFGKMIGIIATPLAGVLLSYYARRTSITQKAFLQQVALIMLACLLFYIFTLSGVATWITGVFYPSLVPLASPYIWIANLAAILLISGSLLTPAVLKFCDTKWQPLIQSIHIVCYIGLGLLFLQRYGLMGFCVAGAIANAIKIILLVLLGTLSLRKQLIAVS